jgi:hypothetical protein
MDTTVNAKRSGFWVRMLFCAAYQCLTIVAIFWGLMFPAMNQSFLSMLREHIVVPGITAIRRNDLVNKVFAWDRVTAAASATSSDTSRLVGSYRRSLIVVGLLLALVFALAAVGLAAATGVRAASAAGTMLPVCLAVAVAQGLFVHQVLLELNPMCASDMVDAAHHGIQRLCLGALKNSNSQCINAHDD